MKFGEKRYNTIDYYLKNEFGKKTVKLSLDGGFTCPNRDGKIDNRGCIFCSESGSGDFTSGNRMDDISEQIDSQIELLSDKWKGARYLAYFQSYTNTYATVEKLRNIYYQAIDNPNISGLCIATRPDCLDDDILELLDEINKKTFLWVELGFQTSNEETADLIRRGYKNSVFKEACRKLNEFNIKIVAHMIINLPGEEIEDYFNTLDYIIHNKVWGIKFHMLHIMKKTDLEKYYLDNKFEFMTADEYIELLTELIARLPSDMVVHRVTGDAPKDLLIEPKWTNNKIYIIGGLEKRLKEKGYYQGILYDK